MAEFVSCFQVGFPISGNDLGLLLVQQATCLSSIITYAYLRQNPVMRAHLWSTVLPPESLITPASVLRLQRRRLSLKHTQISAEWALDNNMNMPLLLPPRDFNARSDYNLEHVVLANCLTQAGILSSEMAYFLGSPGSSPTDTAVVNVEYNHTRAWADNTTTTRFADTGVAFTADLRPEVAQGQWAGTGENGYGSFVCWEKTLGNLFHDDQQGTQCSGVYDCDHQATPSQSSPNFDGGIWG